MDYESPNPFFPKDVRTLINRGIKVPFILGYNSGEGSYFVPSIYNSKLFIFVCTNISFITSGSL